MNPKSTSLIVSMKWVINTAADLFDNRIEIVIKIIPCVEGDRSDCQPEASSIARSRRLNEGSGASNLQHSILHSRDALEIFLAFRILKTQ